MGWSQLRLTSHENNLEMVHSKKTPLNESEVSLFYLLPNQIGNRKGPHLVPSFHKLCPGVNALNRVHSILLWHILPILALGHPVPLMASYSPPPATIYPKTMKKEMMEKQEVLLAKKTTMEKGKEKTNSTRYNTIIRINLSSWSLRTCLEG